MNNAQLEYTKRKDNYEFSIQKLNRAFGRIGSLRLLSFIVGMGTAIYTYILKSYIMFAIVLVLSVTIFIYLLIIHNQISEERKHMISLKDINEKGIKRLKGEWKEFEDDGNEFKDENHKFSGDLDIFGRSSLFQWINEANTYIGRYILKERLNKPFKSSEKIIKNQKAVKELAGELDFRQEYNAAGRNVGIENPESLFAWGKEIDEYYLKPWISIITKVVPIITISIIVLSVTSGVVNYRWGYILICLHIIMLIPGKNKRSSSLSTIYRYKDSIKVYKEMLQLLETKQFNADLLKELKGDLLNKEGVGAAEAINKLSKICDMISERRNIYFIVVDILLLWDYSCMIKLEKWKSEFGEFLPQWLKAVGSLEALSSISTIAFENPEWAEPEFEENTVIKAEGLGHPLIGERRVCNNVAIAKPSDIILITGSNMSGKSTFLRTIGINMILSYIGAPVCAEKFTCSIYDIYTCMRIGDNLEKNISSFYAEILRIKMIVEAGRRGEKIFFLLDEIFKGTNSSDRHLGAKLLIKQLGNEGASGIVSTHDLELGEMEDEYNKIKNYHFQEYYENNELKFDYKLKPGISTTRNALYLIKLAGINVE